MSFGENVAFYRKKLKITQEELAERLFVSRQTVSRWETDSTIPDVDTLMRLCDIFGCDMDTLVRKSAREESQRTQIKNADITAHDEHMKKFAILCGAGVAVLFLAFAVLALCWWYEGGPFIGIFSLVALVAIAIVIFVVAIVMDEEYRKKNPIAPVYPPSAEEEYQSTKTKLTVIEYVIIGAAIAFSYFTIKYIGGAALFLSIVMAGAAAFIYEYNKYYGDRFKTQEYDKISREKGFSDGKSTKGLGETIADSVSYVLTIGGFLSFLFMGVFLEIWHPSWILLPLSFGISIISRAIIKAVFKSKIFSDKEAKI